MLSSQVKFSADRQKDRQTEGQKNTSKTIYAPNLLMREPIINVTKKLKFVLGRVENIVGKGENAGYQNFLLFPQCFQKAFLKRVIKSCDCVGKG